MNFEMLFNELRVENENLRSENSRLKFELAKLSESKNCSSNALSAFNNTAKIPNRNSTDEEIMVSVVMITYNHEEFISEALNSILTQQVDFRYEIIVGDDASTDKTSDIVMEYYRKYPNIIVPVLREENLGSTMNGYDILMRAKGKYIALLEGDDYWTDPQKLKLQVDFLENNEIYVACTHKFQTVDHTGRIIEKNPQWTFQGREYSWKEFLSWVLPSQVGTWVYRNFHKRNDIDSTLLYKANPRASDTTNLLLMLQLGDIYNIDRVMSHYRRDYRSISASWSSIPLFDRRYNIYCLARYYEDYALHVMHRKINFTNIEPLLIYMFTACCDYPSRHKLKCVNEILAGLSGDDKEKYESLYKLIKIKTPFRKIKMKHNKKKQLKRIKLQNKPKNILPIILAEVRKTKQSQEMFGSELENILQSKEHKI